MFSLIVLINFSPEVKIPCFISSSLKVSNAAIVQYGWENYIIAFVIVSAMMWSLTGYLGVIKPMGIVKVSDKDDPKKVYEISIGTLKEAPFEYFVSLPELYLDMRLTSFKFHNL